MPNPYTPATFQAANGFYRVHNNGEQTHVAVLQADDNEYVAVAYDIDPTENEPVAAECIAYGSEQRPVLTAARQWMTAHPKGVLQDAGDGQQATGSGLWARLKRVVKGLDDYGNDLIEQQQGGKP